MSVDAQLRTWVPHFIPAVHATPRSSARSSEPCDGGGTAGAVGAAARSIWSDIACGRSNTAATPDDRGLRTNTPDTLARFLPTAARVSRSQPERFSVIHLLALTEIGGIDSVVK